MNVLIDRWGIPNLLWNPSARFVVRGPSWSTWDHIEGGKSPVIHVLLKYLATASAFASISALDVGGTCNALQMSGMANAGSILIDIRVRSHLRTSGYEVSDS